MKNIGKNLRSIITAVAIIALALLLLCSSRGIVRATPDYNPPPSISLKTDHIAVAVTDPATLTATLSDGANGIAVAFYNTTTSTTFGGATSNSSGIASHAYDGSDLGIAGDNNIVAKATGYTDSSAVTVSVIQFSKIWMKRDIESSDVWSQDSGGSVGEGDTYNFKCDLTAPVTTDDGKIKWEFWDTDGFGRLIASGAGSSFSHIIDDDGGTRARFYFDFNGDGQSNTREHKIDLNFTAKVYTVRNVTVDYASTVGTCTNSSVDSSLNDANTALEVRQHANDVRSTVRFVRSGDVTSWVPSASKPDTIGATADYNTLISNVSGVTVRVIKTYNGIYASTIGLTEQGYPNTTVLLEGVAGGTWAHELGHGLGLGHRTDDINAIMYPTYGIGDSTVLNSSEQSAYE